MQESPVRRLLAQPRQAYFFVVFQIDRNIALVNLFTEIGGQTSGRERDCTTFVTIHCGQRECRNLAIVCAHCSFEFGDESGLALALTSDVLVLGVNREEDLVSGVDEVTVVGKDLAIEDQSGVRLGTG